MSEFYVNTNYSMSHDEEYLRFFCLYKFFLVLPRWVWLLVSILYKLIFLELMEICSFLLIGFWFTQPIAASACQKTSIN
jgi:NAD(P)H-quinone oxidoreductase subunit 5